MNLPSVTPAQIGALLTALAGQAVAFGLLDGQTERLVVASVTAAVAIAWKLADAIIRNGRSRALQPAAIVPAELATPPQPPAAATAPAPVQPV